ncbi:hypothetical protein L914_01371 [Phytophthora nicotianae]|uniref:Uncharacterized protein n=1 Tax=Phytophthora nicotianae TaxID=4792 RepID=W2P3K8_PHYNI|nr:hypothetical protein L914_01371 [Phytophthora nicotianae]
MPKTGGSIAAALDKQLPALEMLVRSTQPTVSLVEKPAYRLIFRALHSIAATRRHAARPTASTDSREAKEELSRKPQ